jgi:DNA-binding transcriptional LysR family regulator
MPRMDRLRKEFPSVDLRFQLISGKVMGPVDDVDLGIRFVSGKEPDYEGVVVMPEILLPICTPGYRDQLAHRAGEHNSDTLINLSGGERDWYRRFPSFQKNGRRPGNTLDFSDYAIVVQAALLGQGIALGWLNVVTHWLRNGALIPAEQEVILTGRVCHLVHSAARPIRSAVSDVRDWIVEETRSDLAAVDALYPALELSKHCRLDDPQARPDS